MYVLTKIYTYIQSKNIFDMPIHYFNRNSTNGRLQLFLIRIHWFIEMLLLVEYFSR